MCTMFMSPNMEGDYTCSILYICGDIPLVSWLIWHVLAGAPCEGIKAPVKGLGVMMMNMYCLYIYAYCGLIWTRVDLEKEEYSRSKRMC